MEVNKETKVREIKEAIDAGNQTLFHLYNARDLLSSASGFGIADLLGLDLIGGIGKHVKIDQAREQMNLAQQAVQRFRKEIDDVSRVVNFQVNIDGFMTFADFFLDGLIMDVWVQAKIGEAKQQVETAINQITSIVEELCQMEQQVR